MSERDAREELAIANRILVDQGVVDAFGHVSVRHPARADRFLLARNMAPASVTPDDILEFDLDGEGSIHARPGRTSSASSTAKCCVRVPT